MNGPSAPPPPVEIPAQPATNKWQVGTLTYTTAGLVILFSWLLWGDFAWSMKDRSVGTVFQLLLKKFEASDMIAGLLIGTVPGAIAMFLGPIISWKSDRHRGRWGRRIPYLMVTTPFAVLSMLGLAFSPALGAWMHNLAGSSSLGLNVSVLIFLGLFWAIFEFAAVTANAVFGGLINDVVPAAVMGRFYGMFRAFSLIAGMIFNFWLMGKAESYYVAIFIGIALLYGLGFTAMCLKVKEGDYPPPPDIPEETGGGFFRNAATYFRESFGIPYYLWFFAVMTLSYMAFSSVNLFSVFFAQSLGMSTGTLGWCLGVTFFISLLLSYPLGCLVDRWHPLTLSLAAQAVYALVTLYGGFFATNVETFMPVLIAHGVVSGTWMTVSASLSQRLLPRSKFAQYGSALGLVVCIGGMIIGPLLGALLDHSDHVYRYTYLAGFGFTVAALITGVVLYRKFLALGGPHSYVAPE